MLRDWWAMFILFIKLLFIYFDFLYSTEYFKASFRYDRSSMYELNECECVNVYFWRICSLFLFHLRVFCFYIYLFILVCDRK